MPAEIGGATPRDGAQHGGLLGRQAVVLCERRPIRPDDVRDLERRARIRRRFGRTPGHGYARGPAFFLGAIRFAVVFGSGGSLSTGLSVAAMIAVLTRV